jgi:hypothetical protein
MMEIIKFYLIILYPSKDELDYIHFCPWNNDCFVVCPEKLIIIKDDDLIGDEYVEDIKSSLCTLKIKKALWIIRPQYFSGSDNDIIDYDVSNIGLSEVFNKDTILDVVKVFEKRIGDGYELTSLFHKTLIENDSFYGLMKMINMVRDEYEGDNYDWSFEGEIDMTKVEILTR